MKILLLRRGLGLRLLHAAAILLLGAMSFFRARPVGTAVGGTSGTLIAYEPFAGAAGPLHGANAGYGWAGGWQVQNDNGAVPGYNFATGAPFVVSGMEQSGNYATGGVGWQTAGRQLDVSANGAFAPWLEGGLIGKAGQTLYFGVLMRKDVNTEDEMSVTLHPGGSSPWWAPSPAVSTGHFGSGSNAGGTRYWSLRVSGGPTLRTAVPVVVGTPAFLVLRMDFGATGGGASTVRLYVNPPAGALPASADATASTANSIAFQSLAWNAGTDTRQSSLDEIRFAASFEALTSGTVPPPAKPTNLSAVPGDRQVALSWSAVSGATSYGVYQIVGGTAHLEATAATNSFTDTGLINRTPYGFYVVAAGPAGQSAPSDQVTAVPRGPAPPPYPVLGSNLSEVTDYSRELPFVDVFHAARPWISQQQGAMWGQGPALQLDANGWVRSLQPGRYAETILLDNALDDQAHYPAGEYTLLYDGEGTLDFDLQSAAIVSQTPGRMVVNVPAGQNGVFLRLMATNPANPVRNIRFVMPGFETTYQSQPFHPVFLRKLQGFRVLRFMEWMLTNGSTVQNWSDRALPGDYTYARRGVPLEVLIQLAGAANLSPWFNIPAAATDDYVRQFATMVNTQLSPALRFYIEYSNETWNTAFSQNAWIRSQGTALGFSADPTLAAADYTAWRATAIFNIFQSVFGGSARMVRVIASQAGNSWLSDQTLAFRNAFAAADALAIAPYFNCDDTVAGGFGVLGDPATAAQVAAMSADQVIDIELAHINGCARQQMESNSAVARKYGLKLVAYEGGQALAGFSGAENNAALTSVFRISNRSPRMTALYAQYLQNWVAAGGDLFVHFSDVTAFTKYGNWGALEYQDQDPNTAPKYQALTTFAAQHP